MTNLRRTKPKQSEEASVWFNCLENSFWQLPPAIQSLPGTTSRHARCHPHQSDEDRL